MPGTDTINFQIGTGVQAIVLGAVLPDVSDPVIIDGATQPGARNVLSGLSVGISINDLCKGQQHT